MTRNLVLTWKIEIKVNVLAFMIYNDVIKYMLETKLLRKYITK